MREPRLRLTLAILCGLATAAPLVACQREDASQPFKLSGRVFVFNYRVAKATYVVTLARNGPLPDNSVVETQFEDPAGGPPITTRSQIFPFWEKMSLESPPVHCVVKGRPYTISIRILDKQGALIQAIETTLTSTLDQTVMPGKPLVVGPVYTPNPDVFRADGSIDVASDASCSAQAGGK